MLQFCSCQVCIFMKNLLATSAAQLFKEAKNLSSGKILWANSEFRGGLVLYDSYCAPRSKDGSSVKQDKKVKFRMKKDCPSYTSTPNFFVSCRHILPPEVHFTLTTN